MLCRYSMLNCATTFVSKTTDGTDSPLQIRSQHSSYIIFSADLFILCTLITYNPRLVRRLPYIYIGPSYNHPEVRVTLNMSVD